MVARLPVRGASDTVAAQKNERRPADEVLEHYVGEVDCQFQVSGRKTEAEMFFVLGREFLLARL